MLHRLYCSFGNTVGIEEFLAYSEIDEDGYMNRYLEIRADGTALRYSRDHLVDELGILPEGQWDEAEARKPEYGSLVAISLALFESAWSNTICNNSP